MQKLMIGFKFTSESFTLVDLFQDQYEITVKKNYIFKFRRESIDLYWDWLSRKNLDDFEAGLNQAIEGKGDISTISAQ